MGWGKVGWWGVGCGGLRRGNNAIPPGMGNKGQQGKQGKHGQPGGNGEHGGDENQGMDDRGWKSMGKRKVSWVVG
jgi:hypothetical protein